MPRKRPIINRETMIARIKLAKLIDKVQAHAMGEVSMTATELRAAEMLINKHLPNVQSVESVVDQKQTFVVETPPERATTDEWEKAAEVAMRELEKAKK